MYFGVKTLIQQADMYYMRIVNPGRFLIIVCLSLLVQSCTMNTYVVVNELSNSKIDESSTTGPIVAISGLSTVSVAESVSAVDIEVTLSKAPESEITVPLVLGGSSTATAGNIDYELPISSDLVFAAGDTKKTYRVSINDDLLDEDNESIYLSIGTLSVGQLGTQHQIQIVILDNDNAPEISFLSSSQSISESVSSGSLSLSLSGASGKTVTAQVSVNGSGTAIGSGTDYTFSASTVTFSPGETSKTVSFSIQNDGVTESDETIIFEISSPSQASLSSNVVHTVTIQNDDIPPSAPTGLTLGSQPTSLASTPTITWSAVAGAVSYEVEVLDSVPASVHGPVALASGASISSLSLNPSSVYTIRVRGVDSFGNRGAWSSSSWTTYCDPYWSSTNLALQMEGANNSTNFVDSSSFAVSALSPVGQAKISTAQFDKGASSAYYDGSGDYISVPANNAWKMGTDYSVEARVHISSGQKNPIVTATGNEGWEFYVSSTGQLGIKIAQSAVVFDTFESSAGVVSAGSWHHVAAVKQGTSVSLYVDGARVLNQTTSYSTNQSTPLYVGGSPTNSFSGYIDEVRITPGIARYSGATLTVPALSLLCQ